MDSGVVSCPKLISSLHLHNCFLSREELIKLFKKYGSGTKQSVDVDLQDYEAIFNDREQGILYKEMSRGLNLHHEYLDYI